MNGELKIGKADIQKLSKRTSSKLIESEDELNQEIKGDTKTVKDINAVIVAQKELRVVMTKMINLKNISSKELNILIKMANELKRLL
ncbi:MAG: hypothetical protein R2822_27890 [Spirosomataceae bacterium]